MSRLYRGPQDLRNLVGRAGEEITAMALSELWLPTEQWRASSFIVQPDASVKSTSYEITPDLWLPSHSALVECKASMVGRRFYVSTRQFEAYKTIVKSATFPVRPRAVYYSFVAFEKPTLTYGALLTDVDRELRASLKFVAVVDMRIVAEWAAEYGDYGRDWTRKGTNEIIYENLFRLTVERVKHKLSEAGNDTRLVVEEATLGNAAIKLVRFDEQAVNFEGRLPTAALSLFEAPVTVDDETTWQYDAAWF